MRLLWEIAAVLHFILGVIVATVFDEPSHGAYWVACACYFKFLALPNSVVGPTPGRGESEQ